MSERHPKIIRREAAAALLTLFMTISMPNEANAETARPAGEPTNKVLRQGFMGHITIGDIEVNPLTYCSEINGDEYCVEVSAQLDELTAGDISFGKNGDRRQMTVSLDAWVDDSVSLKAFSKPDRLDLYDETSRYFGGQLTKQVHTDLHAPNTDVVVEPNPDFDI